LPSTNRFSLPTTSRKGETFGYFFGPGLVVLDAGEEIIYPAAAVVSNNYAAKYRGGRDYDIVIGPGTGSISATGVTGVEYPFAQDNFGDGELDKLEPWGYNAIVNKSATGLQIYGNRTAQNKIETALSLAHVREIIISIQLQMLDLLQPFVGRYNTAQNRLQMKTGADAITSPYVSAGAILSATNQADEKNNTTAIITASQAVLDTTLVFNRGMQIIVHRTKLDKINNSISFETL